MTKKSIEITETSAKKVEEIVGHLLYAGFMGNREGMAKIMETALKEKEGAEIILGFAMAHAVVIGVGRKHGEKTIDSSKYEMASYIMNKTLTIRNGLERKRNNDNDNDKINEIIKSFEKRMSDYGKN